MSIIRDAMRYRTRNVSDPYERATQARATLEFLANSVLAERSHGAFVQAYASFLKHEVSRIGAKADSFLLHDELGDLNQPLYFHEFAERAARHGLEYLAEADFQSVFTANYAPEVATALENSSDNLIDLEQMMDFVRNRMFRQTLLCHDDIAINRTLSTSKLPGLFARSQARPVSPDPDICTVSPEQFRASGGATLTIDHPASKAAMVYLARIAPRASLVEKLCAIARRRVDKCTSPNQLVATAERDDEIVMANLLKAFSYSSNLVQFHVHVPSIATVPSEFPVASPVVRLQAQDNDTVTNLWHERVSVNDTGRRLLCFLDGNNSRDDIFDHLMSEAKQGRLSVKRNDAVVVDKADLRDVLVRNIDLQLSWAAHSALLIR